MKRERNLLKTIPIAELHSAYQEAFRNAKNHLKAAEALAEKNLYGFAIPHLILSTEEQVKGLIIYLEHLGTDIKNIPGSYLFFTDHGIKHLVCNFITVLATSIKPIMKIAEKTKHNLHNPEKKKRFTKQEKDLNANKPKAVRKMFKNLPGLLDWWSEANDFKNKGLYVDYFSSLESPIQIRKSKYVRSHKIILDFQSLMNEFVKHLEKMSSREKKAFVDFCKSQDGKAFLIKLIEKRKEQMSNHKKIK